MKILTQSRKGAEVVKQLPFPKVRWWMRARNCRRGIQLNNDMPPCIEFYVPWWAWGLELSYRLIFGTPRLCDSAPLRQSDAGGTA